MKLNEPKRCTSGRQNSGQWVKHAELQSYPLQALKREPQTALGSPKREPQFLHLRYPTAGNTPWMVSTNTTECALQLGLTHTHTHSKSHLVTDLTTSPRRTRRLFRTHLLILILSSAVVSSERTMQTVSLRLLPFRRTVSPRNNCSSSILACRWTLVESQVNKVLDLIF